MKADEVATLYRFQNNRGFDPYDPKFGPYLDITIPRVDRSGAELMREFVSEKCHHAFYLGIGFRSIELMTEYHPYKEREQMYHMGFFCYAIPACRVLIDTGKFVVFGRRFPMTDHDFSAITLIKGC